MKIRDWIRENPLAALMGALLAAALIWQLSEIIRGWQHVIIAHQGFRQSQTAVSAYYFVKEGFRLTTTIPVFGAPWVLPLEFPLYQWMLAGMVELTGWPLEQCGRAISLACHYLGLLLLFRILRLIGMSLPGALFAVILGTLSPLALYWSQGILIESLSVSITLGYAYCILKGFIHKRPALLIAGTLLGCLASVTKVTTFSVGWGFLTLYGVLLLWEQRDTVLRSLYPRKFLFLLPYLLPLLVVVLWIRFTNSIIETIPMRPNVMGNFDWYFGSLQDRFQPDQWMQMARNSVLWALGSPYPLLLALIPLCLLNAPRLKILVFVAAAFSGPLVFWNVFYVHDYYSYETVFYLCAAIALCFEPLVHSGKWVRMGGMALQGILLASMVYGFYQTPYAWLLRNDHRADFGEFLEQVGESIDENAFIVAAGYDWDPTIAYESERKTVMIRWPSILDSPAFAETIELTGQSGMHLGGILIRADRVPAKTREKLLGRFNLSGPALMNQAGTHFFYAAE